MRTKLLVIGSGAAGYTAAIYAARSNLHPVLVTGMQVGGQLTITTDVDNYPGFAKTVQGPWLMEQMYRQAENNGVKIINDEIVCITHQKEFNVFKCTGIMSDVYVTNSIVFATGAQAKWLGLKSEDEFKGYGVSACATCDGAFFKGKEVVVIGGGNTAAEEALFLTNYAKKVTIIHRRDKFRAEAKLQERLFRNEKISVMWDYAVVEILGDQSPKKVTGIVVQSIKDEKLCQLSTDGVFLAIGHTPNTQIIQHLVRVDEHGYIITKPGTTITSFSGIFAAGDVQDKVYRQAIVAAGTGCMAALDAEKFLSEIPVNS